MEHGKKMSNEEYRGLEGISSTELKKMTKSPAHYRYWKDNQASEDSQALLFGRAYHKFCLETSEFYDEFAVAPEVNKRTKEGKATLEAFAQANAGKDIIEQKDFEVIQEMRRVLMTTPYVAKLIGGRHEESFFWHDQDTDLPCKCRPDSYGMVGEQAVCVDLKTCSSAEQRDFMRDAIKFNYDLQAAYYIDGLKENLHKDFSFVFIAQEKNPPYVVNILEADEMFLASGRDLYTAMLQTYKECSESGNWYGYMGQNNEIASLGLPKWLEKQYEGE